MKIKNNISVGSLAAAFLIGAASCADDFKELNQNPANVTETMPEGLMLACTNVFQPTDYQLWYYNVQYFTRWCQMATPSDGFGENFTGQAESGGQGSQYINCLKYRNVIQTYIDNTGETENNGYLAACGIMTIYLGIFDTDMYGSRPYTEACHYADLGIVKPAYETVEELYDIWIDELNSYIKMLQADGLDGIPRQDPAYGCDWAKWAKLANSLKLKIAVRLYNNDSTKAMAIATEAAGNSAGLITSTDDDWLFNKATAYGNSEDQDYVYGTGNGLATQYATDNVMGYMLASKDPRVRFIYEKNAYNSKVVQSFIDNDKWDDLPSQVKENVILDAEGNFSEWGGMGEPWVRYTSKPVVFTPTIQFSLGTLDPDIYNEYFEYGTRYQVTVTDKSGSQTAKSYNPFCYYTHELRRGRVDFTLPTALVVNEDGSVTNTIIQDTDDNPLYQMYVGAGEINLYMAELALLSGGNFGGKSAEDWYKAGVTASVQEFDRLAALNKIPYYGTTYNYDPFEVEIDLKDGEIEAMLATPSVALSGSTSDKLEKVYLQLLIHFSEQCDDQYVTARRSGYPKVGSSLLPFEKFDGCELSAIPRRFVVTKPSIDDIMYDIVMAAYDEQGIKTFDTSNTGSIYNVSGNAPLNVERLWQDKNAPQWGTPNN